MFGFIEVHKYFRLFYRNRIENDKAPSKLLRRLSEITMSPKIRKAKEDSENRISKKQSMKSSKYHTESSKVHNATSKYPSTYKMDRMLTKVGSLICVNKSSFQKTSAVSKIDHIAEMHKKSKVIIDFI